MNSLSEASKERGAPKSELEEQNSDFGLQGPRIVVYLAWRGVC